VEYLISDFHLDHGNIIDYCDRPFGSVEAMNETLVERWNTAVGSDDEVLYGGDLTIRSSAAALLNWFDELNGEVVFLLGNHDGTVRRSWTASSSSKSSDSNTVEFHSTLSTTRWIAPQTRRAGSSTATTTTTSPTDSPSLTTTPDVSISQSSYWTITH
jgi:predicted phosphohydrolase